MSETPKTPVSNEENEDLEEENKSDDDDSDREFWDCLEDAGHLPSRSQQRSVTLGATGNLLQLPQTTRFNSAFDAGWRSIIRQDSLIQSPEKLDENRALTIMRQAQDVEVANVRKVVNRKLTVQMNSTIDTLRQEFKEKKQQVKNYNDEIKLHLAGKEKDISTLSQALIAQEAIVVAWNHLKEYDLSPMKESKKGLSEIQILQKTIENQRKIIKGMELAGVMFKEHTDDLLERIESLKRESAQNMVIRLQNKREKIAFLKDKVDGLENKILQKHAKYNELKESIKMETSVNLEIQKRLKNMIKDLQIELRNTKAVLAKPQMRERIIKKLEKIQFPHSTSWTPSVSPAMSPGNMSPSLQDTHDIDDAQFEVTINTSKTPIQLPVVRPRNRQSVPYSSKIPSNKYLDRNMPRWNQRDERQIKNQSKLEELIIKRKNRHNAATLSVLHKPELNLPYSARTSPKYSTISSWAGDDMSQMTGLNMTNNY